MDRTLVQILERAFAAHAGADDVLDVADLQKALGVRNEYFARRLLRVLDRNGDGVVRKDEFLAGIRGLVAGTDREKLEFAFRLHDHDGDGTLDREELLRMIMVSLAESDSRDRESQPADQLVTQLLRRADLDRDGRLSFEEFERLIGGRPELLRRMVRSEAIWIAPNEDLLRWLDRDKSAPVLSRTGERGLAPYVLLAVWVLANLGIFAGAFFRGRAAGGELGMLVGRTLGICISFNGALILIPVMRRLLTRLRATFLGKLLPIEESIEFHTILGHTLFALSLAHAGCFVWVYGKGHAIGGLDRLFFSTHSGLTGALLVGVFTVMWICALKFVRRRRSFELFYFTHLLYVAWLGLAIAHAPKFLFWVGVPLLGFVVEQLLRAIRRGSATQIVSTEALRSGVTRIELRKPSKFDFEPGDYVFVRIPAVAWFEWHPFTISSAPERDTLTMHVRSLGNWTSALRRYVEEHSEPRELRAYLDGPYGSPSAHIFRAKYAVLIGAGIGVTPFASVLESMVLRGNNSSSRPSQLAHAHFFWLNNDQYPFEWFGTLLRDLEKSDAAGMLDVHLCMTAARAGATSLGLELARDAMRIAGRSDFFTGLRTHTHLGPPDWEQLLLGVVEKHAPERVDVFYCGPPGLAAKLRPLCARLGLSFREERF